MGFPARLLGEDELLVLDLRPHVRTVVLPSLVLVVVCGLAAFGVAAVPPGGGQGPARIAVLVVAVVLLVGFVLVPFLRWRGTHFVLTDRRVLLRQGVLSRSGRDISLTRINDVTFGYSLLERLLGCGTLVVESGGERGQVVLRSVPAVERVQRTLHDLVEQADSRS